jgi:phage tail-like protein
MAERTEREDPYVNLIFRLSIDDTPVLDFSECAGLSLEVGTEDYAEGGENRFTWKLPTRGQQPNLVLKRGLTAGTALWTWFASYLEEGVVSPRDGQVELYDSPDRQSEPVRVWAFTHGYPVKWTGPELNAQSPAIAFETLEIVHRGLRIKE